ncbi:MAG TPA: hypothetical protein VH854_02990, partial [Thermoanaerobaculia bacterium]|nr:hypothetical protein [Thermoanaerobaculia bacterium]
MRKILFSASLAIVLVAAKPALAVAPSGSFWNPVGPYGGVVVAIAVFPSTPELVYAGVQQGGVFRSDDGGQSFRNVSATLPDLAITALAVSPTSASVVIAGAQSGLYRSADGGTTWSLAAGSPGVAIQNVVFDPADGTIAYAVSPAGWTGRSADGGASWTPIAASLNAQQPTAIAVAPTAHTTVYLGTLQNGVYLSVDSGATFTSKNSGMLNLHVSSLAVDPKNALVALAGTVNDTVYSTGDGGDLWVALPGFTSVDAVVIDGAENAYLANMGGAYVLPAGTQQWVHIPGTAWVNALALGSGSPAHLFTGFGQLPFDSGAVGLFDGQVFHILHNGLTGVTVNAIAVDTMDAQPRILEGTVGDGLLQSVDGGLTWTQVSGLTQNSVLDVVVTSGGPEAFYVGATGGIFKSTDEGTTWTSVSGGLPTNPPSPVASLLIPPGAGAAFLAGTYQGLYRSTDSAGSWSKVASMPAQVIYALAGDSATSGVVYAATEQAVFRSTDGGANWT